MPTALITGASAGLGAEFARQLARRRADLVLVARSEESLSALATELRGEWGVAVEVLPADLSEEDGVERVTARLRDRDDPIDLLVNNAGFGLPLQFADNDIEDEVRHLRLHVEASMRLMHAALQTMRGGAAGSSTSPRSPVSSLDRRTPRARPGSSTSAAGRTRPTVRTV